MTGRIGIAILTCGLLLDGNSLLAQQWEQSDAASVKECLARNDSKYATLANLRLTTLIYAYRNAGDAVPNDKGSSVVWKMGDHYKAEHLGMTTYQDKELSVLIDPDDRSITISAPTDLVASLQGALEDSMLAHVARIGRTSMADGTHFRLKFDAGALYDMVELVFDSQGWLRKEELYWGRPVELNPDDPSSAVAYPKVVFTIGVPEVIDPGSVDTDPGSVLSWKDGTAVPLGPWKDYRVFDTRPQ